MAAATEPLCCNHCRITSWLDALFDAGEPLNPPQNPPQVSASVGGVPPTPPMSTSASALRAGASSSPSKRRRTPQFCDDDDEHETTNDDNQQTPRPVTRTDIQQQQPFAPIPFRVFALPQHKQGRQPSSHGSQISSSSGADSQSQQSRAGSSRRSTSPVKRTQDLRLLAKPVKFVPLSPDPGTQLPSDVCDLFVHVRRITEWRLAFIPAAARDIIRKRVPDGSQWPGHWFIPEDEQGNRDLEPQSDSEAETESEVGERVNTLRAKRQLTALRAIEADAKTCLRKGRAEPAWNSLVHAPLLQLAARSERSRGVTYEQITTAGIVSKWLPEMAGNEVTPPLPGSAKESPTAGGKMVDFALVLELDEPRRPADRALADAVERVVRAQPAGLRSVNQSTYAPLALCPVGVSIETKSSGALEEGRVQLGIWAAAWHRRMSELLPTPVAATTTASRIVTLPLLLCGEHAWNLYFACDRGCSIDIVGPAEVGGTQSLPSLYSLFAVLRELFRWMDGPFRSWMIAVLGVEGG